MLAGLNVLRREKAREFECGFQPVTRKGQVFSVRFFFVIILFLVFDVEICLLFPVALETTSRVSVISGTVVVSILVGGVGVEWFSSTLSWKEFTVSLIKTLNLHLRES